MMLFDTPLIFIPMH